jgi:hypothetical protein
VIGQARGRACSVPIAYDTRLARAIGPLPEIFPVDNSAPCAKRHVGQLDAELTKVG